MATEVTTNAASPGQAAVNQAATGAQAAAPPAVEEAKEPDLSPRFAALTKRERALMVEQKRINELKREAESSQKEWLEYKKIKENAKLNPLAYLEAAGLSYGEVSEFLLNDKKLTPEQRVEMLEQKLMQDEQRKTTEAEAAQKREIEETISQHKKAIGQLVASDPDSYEFIGMAGDDGVEIVFDVIQETYVKSNGEKLLSIQEASKLVEEHLEKEYKEKILNSKKLRPKEPEVSQVAATTTQTPLTRTLTNQALAAAPPPQQKGTFLSEEESKRRAAALLRWT